MDKRIKALEYAIQYVPGTDDNHSASVLLDMLEELKKSQTAATVQAQVTKNIFTPLLYQGEMEIAR